MLGEDSYQSFWMAIGATKNEIKKGRSAQIPAKSEKVIPRPEEKKDKFTDTPIFVD
jgi:hypothetical protein